MKIPAGKAEKYNIGDKRDFPSSSSEYFSGLIFDSSKNVFCTIMLDKELNPNITKDNTTVTGLLNVAVWGVNGYNDDAVNCNATIDGLSKNSVSLKISRTNNTAFVVHGTTTPITNGTGVTVQIRGGSINFA